MASVTKDIDVDVSINVAYNQWTQFATFPQFMEGVESITQIDDTHNHWKVNVGGQEREFDTVIVEQHPDQRIAWKSTDGTTQSGVVSFDKVEEFKTRVTVRIDWEPEGLTERAGALLGFDDRQVEGDLERFKTFIENRGGPTGAWRDDVG